MERRRRHCYYLCYRNISHKRCLYYYLEGGNFCYSVPFTSFMICRFRGTKEIELINYLFMCNCAMQFIATQMRQTLQILHLLIYLDILNFKTIYNFIFLYILMKLLAQNNYYLLIVCI